MGGLVEQQVEDACTAFVTHDLPLAEQVRVNEKRLNEMEVLLDDQCVAIIAKRQPAASDLRNVVGMMKATTDLERMGDEANRIAKMALLLADQEIPNHQYNELRQLSAATLAMLNQSLDAFARLDSVVANEVIAADEHIDQQFDQIVANGTSEMETHLSQVQHIMSQIWAARSLERIGDHAKNMSEYVIYQVRGTDIRHSR